jgi:hypothetical protein
MTRKIGTRKNVRWLYRRGVSELKALTTGVEVVVESSEAEWGRGEAISPLLMGKTYRYIPKAESLIQGP